MFDGAVTTQIPHPLFSKLCNIIQIISDSELSVNFTSCSESLRYEPDVYLGTDYSWLHSLASFSLLNVETCRRMVS